MNKKFCLFVSFVFLLFVYMSLLYSIGPVNVVSVNQEEGTGVQVKAIAQEGQYKNQDGQSFSIKARGNNKIGIESEGVSADCNCEIYKENNGDKTKLTTQLSNGKNAEIKIMPSKASEIALGRLRLKNCLNESGCTIQLKEVGNGDSTKLVYEIQAQRHGRILGLFRAKMEVKAQVDAETGELVMVKKPWWAFLASESVE